MSGTAENAGSPPVDENVVVAPVDAAGTQDDNNGGDNKVTEAGNQETKTEAPVKQPKQREWWEDRIKDQSIENRRLSREHAKVQQELVQLRAAQQQPQQGQPPQQPVPQQQQWSEQQVEARAQQIAAQQQFDRDSNAAWETGKDAYGDFEDVLKDTAEKIGGFSKELIEATLEVGDAHKILYALGKNPSEALRIGKLSPSRMGAALSKLASGTPIVQPSGAPDPVGRGTTPRGVNRGTPDPENMPMAEWLKWRKENERKGR